MFFKLSQLRNPCWRWLLMERRCLHAETCDSASLDAPMVNLIGMQWRPGLNPVKWEWIFSCCIIDFRVLRGCKQPLHVNGTYGINMAILYVKHTWSWTAKPEGEEREESRALNQYWMEDAEVVSTCVMGIETVIFGEKEALSHCLLQCVSAKFIKMSASSIKWRSIGSREPNERRFLPTHFPSLRRIPKRMLCTVCCIGLWRMLREATLGMKKSWCSQIRRLLADHTSLELTPN